MPKYEIFGDDPEEWKQLLDPDKDGKDGIAPDLKQKIENTKEEWQIYFRNNGVGSLEEFKLWRNELALQFANRESNWFQRLMGLAWFDGVLPLVRKHLTPKQIIFYLTKLDKFSSLMPNDFFRKLLLLADKAAESVYTKMK